MADYAVWKGTTRADNNHCLKCVWHSTLEGRFVCCDYSLYDEHGRRDCKAGVGCKYFATKMPERRAPKKRNRTEMEYCSEEAYRALVMLVGKQKMMEITGYSRTGLDAAKRNGRIRTDAAKKLLEETGLDITGGNLIRGR